MDGGEATPTLKKSVMLTLAGIPELGNLAQKYFTCVDKLENSYYLSRPEAVEVLENAALISRLRGTCSLSYGRISSVVGLDQYPWNVIESVAMSMGYKSSNDSFTKNDIEEMYDSDADYANRFYGNDTEQEAIETLSTALARLDVDTVIADDLERLFEISFDPHRVILHFELSTVKKFDKLPGEVIYEFSPRGGGLNRLWEEYEANANEPYLNNAKSVYSLDWSWAKSKYNRPNRELGDGPYRMMEIFEVLGKLAYPTRKYVARLIRALMVRHQQMTVTEPAKMPKPTEETIDRYLANVAAANTATGGTFEQRAVDYAVSIQYREDQYRIAGIGSSVNETNLST
ncbi:Uncharacterised protein [Slackia heliotrinireducens]|nr:hypothetical protein [Slackia heliotrinireducens]VEG98784.1 Uncharacterised protein [Slackia heliotrinireducens]